MSQPNLFITKECFEWCKEQHFANDYQGIWLIWLSALSILIYQSMNYFYWKYATKIKSIDMAYKIIKIMPQLSFYFQISFIIWNMFL